MVLPTAFRSAMVSPPVFRSAARQVISRSYSSTTTSTDASAAEASSRSLKTRFPDITYNSVNFDGSREGGFSIHNGLRVQAALVVDRLPITFTEPEYRSKWKEFQTSWLAKTKNELLIDDSITFMRFPFHFLETEEEIAKKSNKFEDDKVTEEEEQRTDLQRLMGDSGLGFDESSFRKKSLRTSRKTKKGGESITDDSLQSITKSPEEFLWLLVKYRNSNVWTFPRTNRAPSDTMLETLGNLCERQLGQKFKPHVVGSCPFAYEEIKDERKVR